MFLGCILGPLLNVLRDPAVLGTRVGMIVLALPLAGLYAAYAKKLRARDLGGTAATISLLFFTAIFMWHQLRRARSPDPHGFVRRDYAPP